MLHSVHLPPHRAAGSPGWQRKGPEQGWTRGTLASGKQLLRVPLSSLHCGSQRRAARVVCSPAPRPACQATPAVLLLLLQQTCAKLDGAPRARCQRRPRSVAAQHCDALGAAHTSPSIRLLPCRAAASPSAAVHHPAFCALPSLSAGAFTNQIQKGFEEPRLLIVTDPRTDHQSIKEAAYMNIPVIAFCDTDSDLQVS